MKQVFIFTAFALSALTLIAHEFWLDPQKFIYRKGDAINIRLQVGENFEGENWGGNSKRIRILELNRAKGNSDISALMGKGNGDSIQLKADNEGTSMIIYNSNNSFINLEAKKFNAYLKEDGLRNAIDLRAANNEIDSAGREFYQRSVKTIIQTGKPCTNNIFTQTRLPLDIVPLKNPYSISKKAKISFRIFFQQQPLQSQLIKIWQSLNNKTFSSEAITDEKGEINFPVYPAGKWMVSTVKTERLENDPKAQWLSFWGSCTCGYY